MSKAKIHIGKKIKELLDKSPISVVDFAKSINLTRNGAYKVFEKETIDTGQLQNISHVLKHDFFAYYEPTSGVKESKGEYGTVTRAEMKAEIDSITHALHQLTKAVEKMQEQFSKKKTAPKKKTGKK